jgi:hypothetical protein
MAKKRKRAVQDEGNDNLPKQQLLQPAKAKHYERKEDLEWDIQK